MIDIIDLLFFGSLLLIVFDHLPTMGLYYFDIIVLVCIGLFLILPSDYCLIVAASACLGICVYKLWEIKMACASEIKLVNEIRDQVDSVKVVFIKTDQVAEPNAPVENANTKVADPIKASTENESADNQHVNEPETEHVEPETEPESE